MKKFNRVLISILLALFLLLAASCTLIEDISGGNNDTTHTKSYEPITGKFYLYEATDERISASDTYFDIDGSKGNFSLKYYENGVLKREGVFQKIITYRERIGYLTDNLHFNVKCGDVYEHIGTYTESFDPINQFRILEEFNGGKDDYKYYYSELPFVLGTYVREGVSYKEEGYNLNKTDYTIPTLSNYTSELNGKYKLDDEHYFYFVSPKGYDGKDGYYLDSYFQYFAPNLDKPIEGFAHGVTYEDSIAPPRIYFTYSHEVLFYKRDLDTEKALTFGYHTFDSKDNMIDHYGSIDFSNGKLNSFTFEHLSRSWTEEEWNKYLESEDYHLPDAIIYDFVGGTYCKA